MLQHEESIRNTNEAEESLVKHRKAYLRRPAIRGLAIQLSTSCQQQWFGLWILTNLLKNALYGIFTSCRAVSLSTSLHGTLVWARLLNFHKLQHPSCLMGQKPRCLLRRMYPFSWQEMERDNAKEIKRSSDCLWQGWPVVWDHVAESNGRWELFGEGTFLSSLPSTTLFIRALPRTNVWGWRAKGCGAEGTFCFWALSTFQLFRGDLNCLAKTAWDGASVVLSPARSRFRNKLYLTVCPCQN